MEFPNAAETLPIVAIEKKQVTESDNTYNCPIIEMQKFIAPDISNGGTPN